MNLLPNLGDISKIGGTVSTFITEAKTMLETVLTGIKSLGENQVKSHKTTLEQIEYLRTEIDSLKKDMHSYFGEKEKSNDDNG